MQIDEMARKIERLGLEPKQARVLVAGMLLGPAPASKIAEQAKISRPSAYDVLADLEGLGLVERSIRDNLTLFVMVDSRGLALWLEQQAAQVVRRQEQLAAMQADLAAMTRLDQLQQPRIRFVEGRAGIEALHDEAQRKAQVGSIIYSMTNHDVTLQQYPDHVAQNTSRRLKKRLKSRQFYYNSRQQIVSDPAALKETIALSDPIPGDVTLYEDRAVLLSYDGDWSGAMIESPAIVATLRRMFEIAWKNSKKTVEKS